MKKRDLTWLSIAFLFIPCSLFASVRLGVGQSTHSNGHQQVAVKFSYIRSSGHVFSTTLSGYYSEAYWRDSIVVAWQREAHWGSLFSGNVSTGIGAGFLVNTAYLLIPERQRSQGYAFGPVVRVSWHLFEHLVISNEILFPLDLMGLALAFGTSGTTCIGWTF